MKNYEKFPVSTDLMPFVFASPARIYRGDAPGEFGDAWGVPRDADLGALPEKLYADEWRGGNKQHVYVGQAAVEAGFGNMSGMLRSWGARAAGYLVHKADSVARVTDIGAGAADSTIALYKFVGDPDRMFVTLLEPAAEKRGVIEAKLNERGLRIGKHFDIVTSSDEDAYKHIKPASQDVLLQIAAVHHHRSRYKSFAAANAIAKEGGHYVSGDWHSHLWMHPALVYSMLQSMDWPAKTEGLDAFRKAFPNATEEPPRLGCYSQKEIDVFARYWNAWNKIRQELVASGQFDKRDDFWFMEGQCPWDVYARELELAGFNLKTLSINKMIEDEAIAGNPDQLEPDHNLLMGIVAQKTRSLA